MMKMNHLHLVHESLLLQLVKCFACSQQVWLGKICAATCGPIEGVLEKSEGRKVVPGVVV